MSLYARVRHWSWFLPLVLFAVVVVPARAQQPDRCFAETGQCISGRFAEYWQQNGGLPVFGFPITPAVQQQTAEGTFLTQYFERNRFELHPENQRPYDVLLGRLSDDLLKKQGKDWFTFPKAVPGAAHMFDQTGHSIGHEPFWQYWSSHGLDLDGRRGFTEPESLALFGLPLSEPQVETNSSGDTVLTQWFERARFEDHGPKGVLLGLLGNETSGATPQPIPHPQPQPQPQPQPAPQPAPPMDDAAYARHLEANFSRIGPRQLEIDEVSIQRLENNLIGVTFYATLDDVDFLLHGASSEDQRAWGRNVLKELKAHYPNTTITGGLSWGFYTYDVMDEDDCVYVGHFESGEGWYHIVDFVQFYFNPASARDSVDLCL
ncbi:MAG: hypothetical protein M3R24_01800 [Chloroflexota bacterium]|nr:hypothetical protein [Chloroflexota bacterium]